jgi:hypothetical protein
MVDAINRFTERPKKKNRPLVFKVEDDDIMAMRPQIRRYDGAAIDRGLSR